MSPFEPGVIVVGCGNWGKNLVHILRELCVLVAIVDSQPDRLLIKDHDMTLSTIPAYESLQLALEQHPDAAVAIATPPTTHFKIASAAIHAGRSVFVEKPLCTTLSDAQTLVHLAQSHSVTLMVDHLLQFSRPHRQLIHLVQSGVVGTVTRLRMTRLNFGTLRTAENVLWSLLPHDISIMLALLGNQDVMQACVSCHGQATVTDSVEDHVNVFISVNHLQVHMEASWFHPLKERRVVVYGSEGSLILNESSSDPLIPKLQAFEWYAKTTSDGKAVVSQLLPVNISHHLEQFSHSPAYSYSSDTNPLLLALQHFLHCLRANETPLTNGQEALRVLLILSAASESLRCNGAAVKVSDVHAATHTQPVADGIVSSPPFVHPSAIIDDGASIGPETHIWHFTHIMSGAVVGSACNIGQNVFIGGNTVLGDRVKVQNNVSIYDSVTVADDVFLGPSCVFTNVKNPRAHISRKHSFLNTSLGRGVTVGANATIVCGVSLGEYCFIGAGAVVTKDIPAFALAYGNPASLKGWVSTTGTRLLQGDVMANGGIKMTCPESREAYALFENGKDGKEGPVLTRI